MYAYIQLKRERDRVWERTHSSYTTYVGTHSVLSFINQEKQVLTWVYDKNQAILRQILMDKD